MSSPLRSVPQPDSENTRAYKLDLKESSLYLPHAQRILGAYFQDQLILPGSYEDDTQLNTDFITRPSGIRIGFRVRTDRSYYRKYGRQFTFRSDRPSGTETELAKIVRGWGNYFLYGWADKKSMAINPWFLGDLDVFRQWREHLMSISNIEPGMRTCNKDRSSDFRAYWQLDLPSRFFVARSDS